MLRSKKMVRMPAIRLVAVLALLILAGDILACGVLSSGHCEGLRVPSDDMRLHQSHDHCICCCTHVVVVAPLSLPEPAGFTEMVMVAGSPHALQAATSIYHPPKF
jgi:hypothetical protein